MCTCPVGVRYYTLRLQLFAGTNFCFFAIVSQTAKFNTSKNLSCEETVMNVSGLAKLNTSKVHKTSKPQTNVPVKICHFKVVHLFEGLSVYDYVCLKYLGCLSHSGVLRC